MSSQPKLRRALLIALAVVLAAGMLALIYLKADQIRDVKELLLAEKDALQQDKQHLSELEALETESDKLEEQYLRFQGLIPEEPSEDRLIQYIQLKASDAGIRFAEIRFDTRQQEDQYIDMPIDIAFAGDYKALVEFLKIMNKGERAVRIDTIHVRFMADGTNDVRTDIRAHSFSQK